MSTPAQVLGRLPAALVGKPVTYDAPERTVQAILSQQDALVAAIQSICTKLDAASVAGSFATSVGATLSPIQLTE